MKPYLASVIVVNYNSGAYLRRCVLSVLDSVSPVEVILVDNGSKDHSMRLVSELQSDIHRIEIIRNRANIGFSRAVNVGLVQVSCDYVLLLNPDCVIYPQTIDKFCQVLDTNQSVAIAGALVFDENGCEQRGCRRNEPTFTRSLITALGLGKKLSGVDLTYQPLPIDPQPVDAVSGAAMMIRRQPLEAVGRLDEDYFLHCEDLDICRKVRDAGYQILFCPHISVFHKQGVSAGTTAFQVEKSKHRSMLTYYKKHRPKRVGTLGLYGMTLLVMSHLWMISLLRLGQSCFKKMLWWRPVFPIDELPPDFPGQQRRPVVLITGLGSDVGDFLLPLLPRHYQTIGVNRQQSQPADRHRCLHRLAPEYFAKVPADDLGGIDVWINLAPIWTSSELATVFERFRPQRIIALSSTSVISKRDSEDPRERHIAQKLNSGEQWLMQFSEAFNLDLCIFRPTLIYGGRRNKNINFIKKTIKFFRVFPILEKADSLRQPVHAEDVACACVQMMQMPLTGLARRYDLGGAEQLTYRDMIVRVYDSLKMKPRMIEVPLPLVKWGLRLLRWLPGLGFLSPAMAGRMSKNLVCPIDAAKRDFSFQPRNFEP